MGVIHFSRFGVSGARFIIERGLKNKLISNTLSRMDSFRLRSVSVIALIGTLFAVGCGAVVAFAQDAGTPPPPPLPPPSGGDFSGSQPQGDFNRMPPPPNGDFGGGYQQPPQGGFDGGRMMPPPPPQGGDYRGDYRQPSDGQYPQGGFQGRPPMPPQGDMMQPGSQKGQFGGPGGDPRMMQQYGDGGPRGGSRGDFEDRGSRGDEGGFGGGEFEGGFGGEEEGDDFEAREAEQQERMLSEMKRNLRGMEQGLKMIKNMADKLTKQGVAIPSEYATLVSDLTNALGVVKNATEFSDEVESAMSVIMERGEELRDAGPRLGALSQWPKTLKQAEAQVKRLDTQFARVKKNKSASAYPDLLARVEAAVGTVRSALAQAKSEASGGDIEGAMETLRDGVFEATEDAYDALRVLDNIANMSRMVKQAEKEILRYEKEAARYEKQKKDTTELRNLIGLMKSKLAEVKEVMSSGEVNHDDLFGVMSAAEEIRNDADAELQHLRGKPSSSERPLQNSSAERAGASVGKALQAIRGR